MAHRPHEEQMNGEGGALSDAADALRAHAVAPHMKAYASQVKDLTASRAIHVLQPA